MSWNRYLALPKNPLFKIELPVVADDTPCGSKKIKKRDISLCITTHSLARTNSKLSRIHALWHLMDYQDRDVVWKWNRKGSEGRDLYEIISGQNPNKSQNLKGRFLAEASRWPKKSHLQNAALIINHIELPDSCIQNVLILSKNESFKKEFWPFYNLLSSPLFWL